MSIDLGSAVVTIQANTALLASGISGAKVLMADFAVSAAGAAGAVLDLGAKFQQQNTMLITSAGEAQSNLKLISDGVLQTSVATGTSTDQLEAAMYKIESSGQHGTAALTDLAAAAEGAKLENSNLADVANAEMTVMTDYASKHITAAQAVNDLIATVAHGRANIQDMSLAMSTVLPTANAVGVSLYDTSAALAVMTARGTDAASAATYLKQMLLALDAPSSKAVKTLADIGLSASQVSDEMKISLPGTLQLIEDHLKTKFPEGSAAYVAALKDISGGSRTMQGILQLTGSSLQTFTQDAKDVAAAVQDGGTKIDGWALAQQNASTKLDQAKASVEALGIKIGTALLPVVSNLATAFTQDVMPQLDRLAGWVTTTGLPALQNFGGWFTHDAVPALQNFGGIITRDVLPPASALIGNTITLAEHFGAWLQSSGALNLALHDVSSTLGTLVGWVSSFEQGLMNGNPQVALLAGGISAVGTAIGLVKIEEFAAGWYNWFQQMNQGAGLISNLTAQALPNLTQAFKKVESGVEEVEAVTQTYWLDMEAGAKSAGTQIEAIGPEAEATAGVVSGAAIGMQTSLGLATAGISLLIGATVSTVIEGNGKITQSFKDTEAQLGNSAADNAAKQKATVIESATVAGQQWHSSYAQQQKDANDAKAIAILDQQQIADAAAAAAQKAQDSYNNFLLWWQSQGIDATGRNFEIPPPVTGVSHGAGGAHGIPTHATGGTIPPGQFGIVNDQPGAGNGELLYNSGSSGIGVIPAAQSAAMWNGAGASGPTEVHNHIYLDGRELTSILMNRAVSEIRRATGVRR